MKNLLLIFILLLGYASKGICVGNVSIDTSTSSAKSTPEVVIKNNHIKEIKNLMPIQTNTSLYIKNYGDGQLSTIQYRGFNATHNDVEWLGIPLYSPYNASVDLSMIPFQIVENGASYRNLGTSFSIAEEDKPTGLIKTQHQFQTQVRLYNFYQAKYHYNHQQPNDKISFDIDLKKGENNYLFNRFGKKENLIHNEFEQYSLYGHYGMYNNAKSIFHGFYSWFNYTHRNIPPTINQFLSVQQYAEKSFRSAYTLSHPLIQNTLFVEINQSQFQDDAAYIFSIYNNQSIRNKFNLNKSFGGFEWQYSLLTSLDLMQTTIFKEQKILFNQHHQIKISKNWNNQKLILTCMMVGQQGNFNIPQPSLQYIHKKNNSTLGIQNDIEFKMKTRFPSANDLYWPIVGNKDLLPEQSYQGMHHFHLQFNARNFYTRFSTDEFIYYTHQLINWIPTASGQWTPHNLAKVLSYGVQPKFIVDWQHKIKLTAQYQFNPVLNLDPTIPSIYRKQILYSPIHKWSNEIELKLASVMIQTTAIYTAERFYTTDNSLSLEPYLLVNIKFVWTHKKIEWGMRIDNVLNADYQEIAERPMPGIMPALTIKYTVP